MAQIPDLTSALQEVARGMGGKGGKAKANRGGKGAGTKARAPKAPKELKPCECGCGKKVARHFAQGHDMKLKGRLRKAAADGNAKAKAELKQRGW